MTIRPILFSAPMVRALLDGRKTQTRRIINVQRYSEGLRGYASTGKLKEYLPGRHGLEFIHERLGLWNLETNPQGRSGAYVPIKYFVGDRLWVRETWRPLIVHHCAMDACDCADVSVQYCADAEQRLFADGEIDRVNPDWTMPQAAARGSVPSIYMPRWASRLTLEVTGVKVERLQDISEDDARAEGIIEADDPGEFGWNDYTKGQEQEDYLNPYESYWTLWDATNGVGSWSKNPEVVAITFRVIRANIDSAWATPMVEAAQ